MLYLVIFFVETFDLEFYCFYSNDIHFVEFCFASGVRYYLYSITYVMNDDATSSRLH